MEYRRLGKTGLDVSAIGLGCGLLGSSDDDYAPQVVQRALDLGVNYFDTARSYRDSELKLGRALAGQRHKAIISTKTRAVTREDAWRELNESLERLQTDYVDNWHLHGLMGTADIEERMGAGGALEALVQAKEQGLTRHIGCTGHRSATLIEAIRRFDFDIILVPMNLVEREPLDELIPLCHQRAIGVSVMKPVATGLLPATLALKWLLNQPVATIVPGATTLEEVTENSLVGSSAYALTEAEAAQVEALRDEWEHKRCRICDLCLPCPQQLPLPIILGTDVMYDHYRTMGPQGFRSFRWSRQSLVNDLKLRPERITAIESCTRCGECEARCPYGLPIMDMLPAMLPAMRDMVAAYQELLNTAS